VLNVDVQYDLAHIHVPRDNFLRRGLLNITITEKGHPKCENRSAIQFWSQFYTINVKITFIKFCFPVKFGSKESGIKHLSHSLSYDINIFKTRQASFLKISILPSVSVGDISTLLLAWKASRAKLLISYDKGCDKCITYNCTMW
jgi:hypothetical protein